MRVLQTGHRENLLFRLMRTLDSGPPYAWQTAAFESFKRGEMPLAIQAPTGAGKTALMVCWLAALAEQSRAGLVTLPRRYMVVINRRALVDAASDLALRLLSALEQPELSDVRDALLNLSPRAAGGLPLIVSTLRGQMADTGSWAMDPARPAIIAATPDMAGSRLLFGGYGLGRSRRATHAGILGVDTLVVHDESHLAPAFTGLLRCLEKLAAPGARLIGRPQMSVIEMTATPRDLSTGRPVIACDPATSPELTRRLQAEKQLRLIAGGLAELVKSAVAHASAGRAVIVYISAPEDAGKVASTIAKAGIENVACLTGTMRGLERDLLLESAVIRCLEPRSHRPAGGAVLVSTAAGEIGIDLDADVLLCDAVTLDRLAQRAGRCNRRGLTVGLIDLYLEVGKRPKALESSIQKALELLMRLPKHPDGSYDASPMAISALLQHPDYNSAIEPAPVQRALAPDVVDLYALTSLPLLAPRRSLYIHGVQSDEPDVCLVWRRLPHADQVEHFTDWLQAWPVSLREQARLPISKAEKFLAARLAAWQTDALPGLIVSEEGERIQLLSTHARLNQLKPGDWLLLACELGGLSTGGVPEESANELVADVSGNHVDAAGHERATPMTLAVSCKFSDSAGARWHAATQEEAALPEPEPEREFTSLDELLAACLPGWQIAWHDPVPVNETWAGMLQIWPIRIGARSPDDGDQASQTRCDRSLQEHQRLAGRAAARLLTCLPLSEPFGDAVLRGAPVHDAGKAFARWQAAIGNRNVEPLAKSARPWFDTGLADSYRHELGSVVGAQHWSALVRHLVVAHHGWGRPGFLTAALNHPGCDQAARQAGQDFGLLHDAVGPWALAYLEALLKSSDVHAELMADDLLGDADPPMPDNEPMLSLASPAAKEWRVAANARNPGEYFACLGVAALARALDPRVPVALQW